VTGSLACAPQWCPVISSSERPPQYPQTAVAVTESFAWLLIPKFIKEFRLCLPQFQCNEPGNSVQVSIPHPSQEQISWHERCLRAGSLDKPGERLDNVSTTAGDGYLIPPSVGVSTTIFSTRKRVTSARARLAYFTHLEL